MMRSFTDMTGRVIEVSYPPKRVVSVVPSQTELLHYLGLEEEVVGITKFCVHPQEWFRNKTRIGGTKKLHIDEIHELQPDLIIANKEENTKEEIEELAKSYPVWISDIQNVAQALEMIMQVGLLTGKEEEANWLVADINKGFDALQKASLPRRVAYFIWYKPWMSVGADTFINDVIDKIGWWNVLQDKQRYPEVTLAELNDLQPELILLSSEPFPFKEKHVAELKENLPATEVALVDGEMFSWYGSRMLHAVSYLTELVKQYA
jgi:ABC-type Fe3+-hydroxamate transport system substrate-binding protein